MSIRIFELPPKTIPITATTKIPTEDPTDESNKSKQISAVDILSFVWSASDEDSALTVGTKYTTEVSTIQKTINKIIISLKNSPTGSVVEVDILKETGLDTNEFVSIFTTKPTIDINKFSSISATPAVILNETWEVDRRLQIRITLVDSNFAATGLKVELR